MSLGLQNWVNIMSNYQNDGALSQVNKKIKNQPSDSLSRLLPCSRPVSPSRNTSKPILSAPSILISTTSPVTPPVSPSSGVRSLASKLSYPDSLTASSLDITASRTSRRCSLSVSEGDLRSRGRTSSSHIQHARSGSRSCSSKPLNGSQMLMSPTFPVNSSSSGVGSGGSAMGVFVRVRPILPRECSSSPHHQNPSLMWPLGTLSIDDKLPDRIAVLDPNRNFQPSSTFTFSYCFGSRPSLTCQRRESEQKQEASNGTEEIGTEQASNNFSPHLDREENSDQGAVYERVGRPILMNTLEGYNGCIFAYGQTGSGKTFTMYGGEDINASLSSGANPKEGIIPRVAREMLDQLEMKKNNNQCCSYRVEVSFYEIYQEKVYDLLSNSMDELLNPRLKVDSSSSTSPAASMSSGVLYRSPQSLRVRQHALHGAYVEGLRTVWITKYEEFAAVMDKGTRERHTAATQFNDRSSRSHAIVTFNILQVFLDDEGQTTSTSSKLNLVDLAGSERSGAAGSEGTELRDGISINLSLTVLGRVIDALADRSQRKGGTNALGSSLGPIPYRESKLTWLLSDSLGGNSQTAMIATVSPYPPHYEEMRQTLRYASRAKQIVNQPIVNEDPHVRRIRDLNAEVRRLQEALDNAQESLENERKNKCFIHQTGDSDTQVPREFPKEASSSCLLVTNPTNCFSSDENLVIQYDRAADISKAYDWYCHGLQALHCVFESALETKMMMVGSIYAAWAEDILFTHDLMVSAFQEEIDAVREEYEEKVTTVGNNNVYQRAESLIKTYLKEVERIRENAAATLREKNEHIRLLEKNFNDQQTQQKRCYERELHFLRMKLSRSTTVKQESDFESTTTR